MRNIYILLILFSLVLPSFSALAPEQTSDISRVENLIFGKSFSALKMEERLLKIEKPLFGKTFSTESIQVRINRINEYLLGYSEGQPITSINDTYENKAFLGPYENSSTKEISFEEFESLFLRIVNNERSYKGLLPLQKDETAFKVASDEALDLLRQGQVSFYNSSIQGPDERYTLAGGTGALIEVIRGFELDRSQGKIILSELLIKQLIEAIAASPDDAQILYNPHITHIGYGFALSKDKTKFVSVLDFLTKAGEFEPIKISANLLQKVNVSGKLKRPFKFKAVSIAYLSNEDLISQSKSSGGGFDVESLKPYFPPQDFIAYTDKSKSNVLKVLQGIGVIGAIGAAPFTGGATSFLAPVFLNSLQNGPPKEIPLKGGMKSNSDGSFYGNIELNNQGMVGLYYVSVIAELPGLNSPIIVSRRTVRVNSPTLSSKDTN